jgi:hypothetical protein
VSLEFVSWVFVGYLGLEFLFYVFFVFMSFEFLSYVLVAYMSLFLVHAPFAQKPFLRKYFAKAKMMDSTTTLKKVHHQG